MTIQIEVDVPIPPLTRVIRKEPTYPFAQMSVGHSFAVKTTTQEEQNRVENRLRGATARYAKQEKGTVKFTVRALENEVRVWRVA
jgi:hypothetical protein